MKGEEAWLKHFARFNDSCSIVPYKGCLVLELGQFNSYLAETLGFEEILCVDYNNPPIENIIILYVGLPEDDVAHFKVDKDRR